MFKERKKGIEFLSPKGRYMVPSKMFPLSSKKKYKMFHVLNTVELENEQLAYYLNQAITQHYDEGVGRSGRCYTNAYVVQQAAEELELNVTYYSGWLFVGPNSLPVHHAWAIVGEDSLVDIAISPGEFDIMQEADFSKPEFRKDIASKLKDYASTHKDVKYRIYGKVPEGLVYIGSEDTAENARNIFEGLGKEFPNHPSYGGGGNMKGQSQLQKELDKQ